MNRSTGFPLINNNPVIHKDVFAKVKLSMVNDGPRRNEPLRMHAGKVDPGFVGVRRNDRQARCQAAKGAQTREAHPEADPFSFKHAMLEGGFH